MAYAKLLNQMQMEPNLKFGYVQIKNILLRVGLSISCDFFLFQVSKTKVSNSKENCFFFFIRKQILYFYCCIHMNSTKNRNKNKNKIKKINKPCGLVSENKTALMTKLWIVL